MISNVLFAVLPDPAQPATLAFGGALGAFLGGTAARLLRLDREERAALAHALGYGGFGVALLAYLVANLMEGYS